MKIFKTSCGAQKGLKGNSVKIGGSPGAVMGDERCYSSTLCRGEVPLSWDKSRMGRRTEQDDPRARRPATRRRIQVLRGQNLNLLFLGPSKSGCNPAFYIKEAGFFYLRGIFQAKRLKSKLIRLDFKIGKVYSSDLKRALETAKIVFQNKSIELSSDFREMNFGILKE